MVGADAGRRGDVGLSQKGRGGQERVVVVLLVEGKDQVVEHFAAGNRRVFTEEGYGQTTTVL